jgi:hypothetical protein
MKFMMIVPASPDSEAGKMPTAEELEEMAKFNDQLIQAGVMLEGNGLHPTSKGWRVEFSGNKRRVVDGPFAEAKEVIAGYWIIEVKSREEALEWSKRIPFRESHVEVRQIFDAADFGPEAEARVKEQEQRIKSR